MPYSLLSRLQGCLLGMVLGEHLGKLGDVAQASPASAAQQRDQEAVPRLWSPMAIDLLQTLTRSHQWQSPDQPTALLQKVAAAQRHSGGIAIATLPVALFFHDDLNRQRQALWQVFEAVSVDDISRAWVTVFAYAIAQAVKGQLDPDLLIPQILAYLRVTSKAEASISSVFETLEQIESHAVEQASLHSLQANWRHQLDPIAIALALFLQTPEDWRLALTRATQLGNTTANTLNAPVVHALLGALVGGQASLAGIPPSYQASQWLPTEANLSVQRLKELTEALIASWSGLYDVTTSTTVALPVAAPWVIRP